ncbi:transglycosylase domain-containing protein [Halobacillus campisalis]|uniref:Transglycosylase domain-containing protein n=1 Tax=Halobacillus campisalis TaxID=435909 RepID=A0ABW2K0Y7_9BACI|nr:transglycosylase domain-containing protein [Halobacillus campisalis]
MANSPNNGRKKIDWKALWQTGKIQRSTRIGYDVVWNVILFFIIIGVVGLFFAGGVGAGYFASLVKDEPTRPQEEMEEEIYNYEETSQVYFSDEKLLGNVRTDLYRQESSLDDISDNLEEAVIATEDEYFNNHDGIVPKAVLRAMVQEATNASTQTGGSTLTQQIVKNQILTSEVSFERKAKEMLIAMRIERFFEKDEILEAYLNIVPFGRNANGDNIAGAETAAKGIFGVSADELSIPQAAFIAGLPQNPYSYTPFLNNGEPKSEEQLQPGLDRMNEVLSRMHDTEYISDEEYQEALKFDLAESLTEPKSKSRDKYPFLTDEVKKRAKEIIVEQLAKENGDSLSDLNEDEELAEEYSTLADRQLSSGGYKIHTTIDQEVYDVMQEVKDNYNNYGRNKVVSVENSEGELVDMEIPVQVGSTLIENTTGKIIGFIGGRDFEEQQLNHATRASRSPGSTMKPLAAYGPGIDMGEIHPGSVFADVPFNYPESTGGKELKNYGDGYNGFTSSREALKKSYNIPAVEAYMDILDENPGENYLDKMGFTTFNENDYVNPSFVLGTSDVTNEENTNAYATFGNNGDFVDAYMIEKIETKEGETFYEHESEKEEVFSPQASYLTVDMMRDVLDSGTAASVPGQLSNPDVDWAGKTGTSQEYKDAWFVATNPNVTMSMWMGYDFEEQLDSNGYSSRNTGLWADVVNAVSEIRPDLMVPENDFEEPEGIETNSYCATSGLLASDLCESVGITKSDLYISEFAPSEEDDSLTDGGDFVKIKGNQYPAGDDTPSEFIIEGGSGVTIKPEFLEENDLDTEEKLEHLIPNSNAWDDVALPSLDSSASSSEIENDGENPSPPGSVSAGSSSISWSQSSSDDVVGYRVYRASSPGGSFSRVGSTRSTSYSFSGQDGIYAVRAVDYFGESSSLSSTTEVSSPGTSSNSSATENNNSERSVSSSNESDNETDSSGGNSDSSSGESENGTNSSGGNSGSSSGEPGNGTNSSGGNSGSSSDESGSETDSSGGNSGSSSDESGSETDSSGGNSDSSSDESGSETDSSGGNSDSSSDESGSETDSSGNNSDSSSDESGDENEPSGNNSDSSNEESENENESSEEDSFSTNSDASDSNESEDESSEDENNEENDSTEGSEDNGSEE